MFCRVLLLILIAVALPAHAKFGDTLATNRIQLRKAMDSDLQPLEKLFTTREMYDFYFLGEPQDPRIWIEYSRSQPSMPSRGMKSNYYVIADQSTNEFRGIVTVIANIDLGTREVSYAIAPEFRKLGIASEALDLVIEQAFWHDPEGVVLATVAASNEPSQRLLKSKGFQQISGFNMNMQMFELTISCERAVGGR